MDLSNALFDKETINDIKKNCKHNQLIIKHIDTLLEDKQERANFLSSINFTKIRQNVLDCNDYWYFHKYEQSKIKDLQRVNLCRNKFCSNCKKVIQSTRMQKYIPALEPFKDNMFHLVLTVPNVTGIELPYTLKKMSKCFSKLIRYFSGNAKIKDLDFSTWNYQGAVRSLEITYTEKLYHPHFHIGIIFDDIFTDKNIVNKYSYSYGKLKNYFSFQEVLIQKIWYLLMNDEKVTAFSIAGIENGYSCNLLKFKSEDYAELFKYLSKNENEEKFELLSYENFIDLYYSLYRVKQIQGYGILYHINDNLDLEEYNIVYDEFINELQQKESPQSSYERLTGLQLTQYSYISRKSYFKYLKQIL